MFVRFRLIIRRSEDVLSFRQHLPASFANMLRQSPSFEKGHPHADFRVRCLGGDENVRLDSCEILRSSSSEWKVLTSEDVSQMSTVLIAISGVEIDKSSESTSDWDLFLSMFWCTVGGTTVTIARMLKGLDDRFSSLWLRGIIGFCLP